MLEATLFAEPIWVTIVLVWVLQKIVTRARVSACVRSLVVGARAASRCMYGWNHVCLALLMPIAYAATPAVLSDGNSHCAVAISSLLSLYSRLSLPPAITFLTLGSSRGTTISGTHSDNHFLLARDNNRDRFQSRFISFQLVDNPSSSSLVFSTAFFSYFQSYLKCKFEFRAKTFLSI